MADTGDGRGFTKTLRPSTAHINKLMVLAQRRIEHSQDKPVLTLRQLMRRGLSQGLRIAAADELRTNHTICIKGCRTAM